MVGIVDVTSNEVVDVGGSVTVIVCNEETGNDDKSSLVVISKLDKVPESEGDGTM